MDFRENIVRRWFDLHLFWRFLIVIAVIAGVAFAAAGPALGHYRDWQGQRALDEARHALAAGHYFQARDRSRAAMNHGVSAGVAMPVLLRAADALGDPRRSEIARRLLEAGGLSLADRLFAWNVVCRSGPMGSVIQIKGGMPETERATPEFLCPLLDRMILEGMDGDAARLLTEQPHPLSPELELRLMHLLLAKDNDAAFRQFQVSLISLLQTRPAIAGPFVPLLDGVPQENLVPGTFGALVSWHETHPTDAPAEILRLARCEMAASRARQEEIFAAALTRFRHVDPLATARWCLQTRRLDEAENVLAGSDPSLDPEAFDLLRRIYAENRDIDRWDALLSNPPASAFLPEIHCDRALIADLRNDQSARLAAENEALRTAADAPGDDAFIRLARHAATRDLDSLAERAWVEAVRQRHGPLPLASRLKPVIEAIAAAKRERELIEIVSIYRFIEPANPVIAVQLGYLSCLNGRATPDQLIRDLSPIHQQMPEALPVRCVLALAHLLQHLPAEALELTEEAGIDWLATSPAYRAIRGIALASNSRREEAAVLFEAFPWNDLLPSERRVLRGLLESAQR